MMFWMIVVGIAIFILSTERWTRREIQKMAIPPTPPTEDEIFDIAFPVITAAEILARLGPDLQVMLSDAGQPCPNYKDGKHRWRKFCGSDGFSWDCRSCGVETESEALVLSTMTEEQRKREAAKQLESGRAPREFAKVIRNDFSDIVRQSLVPVERVNIMREGSDVPVRTVRIGHESYCDGDIPGSPGCICELGDSIVLGSSIRAGGKIFNGETYV